MTPEVQQLLWRSRRGMLELDALFKTYLESFGDDMSSADVALFTQLLEQQDQDLFDAFNGKNQLEPPVLHELFTLICQRVGQMA